MMLGEGAKMAFVDVDGRLITDASFLAHTRTHDEPARENHRFLRKFEKYSFPRLYVQIEGILT